MKRKDRQFSIPYQFKFIGLGLLVLMIVAMVGIRVWPIGVAPSHVELVKHGAFSLLLLSLFLIAVSDEKVEDERAFLLRVKGFAGAFSGAIIYVIIKPFLNRYLSDMPMEVSGQEVALVMLFVYLITYYVQKFTGKE